MPLHPQCRALLDEMEAAGVRPFEELSVPEARAAAWGYLLTAGDPQAVAAVADRYIPGPHGDIHVRVYTPEGGGPRGGIVFFHGSGWVIANIDICDAAVRSLANSTAASSCRSTTARRPSTSSPCRSTSAGRR